MNSALTNDRKDEQGSALIIALLVAVILSLLGVSYLLMAKTESVIAENERNSAMALYVAEAGARMTINWFNDPDTTTGFLVPTSANVTRSLRLVDADNNTATPRVLANSGDADTTTTAPIYKDSAFTGAPIFDRPYRGLEADTFLGIELGSDADPNNAGRGPDLVVNTAHLATINDALFLNFPTNDLRARITAIEIYGPPEVVVGGVRTRMGVATVKVTGGVVIYPGTANERQIATRIVKAVINEVPVPGPTGPLQSCNTLNYTGDFKIHWGTGSSAAGATIPSGAQMGTKIATAIPYALNDPFTYWSDIPTAKNLSTWATDHDGDTLEDPWFKFIAGGSITGAPNSDPQPWPFVCTTCPSPPSPRTYPGDEGLDHSNIFQNTVISCPTFDYALWKSIAQSGNRNNFYYAYDSATQNFKLDGTGTAQSFAAATTGRTGLFFFDTVDGLTPRGLYTDSWPTTNLTPDISVTSAQWPGGVAGFVFLNAKSFGSQGTGGSGDLRWIVPPGEPGDAAGFVNLDYPSGAGADLTDNPTISQTTVQFGNIQAGTGGAWYCTDALNGVCGPGASASPTVRRDDTGLPFQDNAVLDGVFYTSGVFTAQGNASFFGSLVAQQGVLDGGGTPGFYFDERLIKGQWPPKGMSIPRVVVTGWQTDL
jgi:hypothetical protein